MKVLNQMGPQVAEMIRSRVPGVEIEAVPLEGSIPRDLSGDVLLSFRRASTMVEAAQHVPWLHIAGAGVEGLDQRVFEDGRIVSCSRGAHAIPIAEHVMAAIIAYEKRIPAVWIKEAPPGNWMPLDELEARIQAGDLTPPADEIMAAPERWGWTWMGELAGRTVGIIGLGGIGAAVAKRALAFDMNVVAVRRSDAPSPVPGVELTKSLDEVLGRSDHLVVCAPVTPATRNMLNDEAFAKIKPGSHVINVARGVLIDEDALLRALDSGRVSLASLDVAVGEPLESGHPFYSHPRIRLSPHISWTSPRRQERVIEMFIENLKRRERGERLLGVVDPEIGY